MTTLERVAELLCGPPALESVYADGYGRLYQGCGVRFAVATNPQGFVAEVGYWRRSADVASHFYMGGLSEARTGQVCEMLADMMQPIVPGAWSEGYGTEADGSVPG